MKKKEIIKSIIREFHNSEIPAFVKRQRDIPLNSGKIISIIGPRRAGKTYLLYQLMAQLLNMGVAKDKILYVNFEDERIGFKTDELDLIIQSYRELYPETKMSETYIFFDEVQNIENWERFIRRLHDQVSKNIFITGSNSKLLGEQIATALRGRILAEEILPLDFREFLRFKGFDLTLPQDFFDSTIRARLLKYFTEFMLWGSFPEIIFQPDNIRYRILQEYFNVMIYRDLIERHSIKETFVLKYFIKRLAEGVGKPISINKIYNELKSQGIKVSKNILYKYLEYLENAFVIRRTKKKKQSIIQTELTDKKVYFIDNGLLRAIKLFESQDYGVLFENLIFREIIRSYGTVFFYKERKECDFLVDDKIAIQTCYELANEDTKKREIEGLISCMREFKLDKGMILTLNNEESIKINGYEITVLPAYKWLLTLK